LILRTKLKFGLKTWNRTMIMSLRKDMRVHYSISMSNTSTEKVSSFSIPPLICSIHSKWLARSYCSGSLRPRYMETSTYSQRASTRCQLLALSGPEEIHYNVIRQNTGRKSTRGRWRVERGENITYNQPSSSPCCRR
jgi:hypothetical protein